MRKGEAPATSIQITLKTGDKSSRSLQFLKPQTKKEKKTKQQLTQPHSLRERKKK